VCNLPGGIDGDPGLLEFDDVRTSFHEFGHLLHHIFAGNRRWFGTGGIRTELDFQEAPPQMLEECIWDTKTLQTFARHFETGQPIPDNLLKQMKRAREFGKGSYVRSQIIFAKMSLLFHDQNPSKINTDQITKSLTEEYGLFPFVEGTHYQCKFTHLDNYSALVYTYLWSQVIAKDLFSQFNKKDLLCSEVAKKYRATILNPGGSASASTLIENFLGRPFNFKAWQDWLDSD
jgi:thimet oligopeptidase